MTALRKEFIPVLGLTLLVVAGFFLRTNRLDYSDPDFTELWDHYYYIEMATGHPAGERFAPFEYRILNPLLASVLPFEISVNFTILNLAALTFSGVIFYYMLKAADFSKPQSVIGLLFYFSLGWAVRFNIYDFWITDPLSYAFTAAALWSILTKKDLAFALLLAAGVLAKESVLFVAPLYYTLNTKKLVDGKVLLRFITLTAPAVLMILILRSSIPTTNPQYNLPYLWETIGSKRIIQLLKDPADYIPLYTIGSFGVSFFILPFFAMKKNLTAFLKFSPFIALTYLSLLLAYNTERLLVALFPVMTILALYGIQNITDKTGVDEKVFLSLPLALIVLLLARKDWFLVPSLYDAILFLIVLAVSLQAERLQRKPGGIGIPE